MTTKLRLDSVWPVAITGIWLILCQFALGLVPDVQLQWFSRPSAFLTASFMGVPCVATGGGFMLMEETLAVHVTIACSAVGFFSLLSALMAGLMVSSAASVTLWRILTVLGGCYAITLLANATRIMMGWMAWRWVCPLFPVNCEALIHMAAGVLVFLSWLVFVYGVGVWRMRNEQYKRVDSVVA